MPGGRPSLYREEYCEEIVKFCRKPRSITAFAGHIGVSRRTLTEWGEQHEEFSLALARAKAAACLGWEERGDDVHEGRAGSGANSLVVFAWKNFGEEDYRDKQETALTGPNGGAIKTEASIDVRSLSPEERAILKAALVKKGE